VPIENIYGPQGGGGQSGGAERCNEPRVEMTNQRSTGQQKPDARKGRFDAVSLFGASLRNPSGPAVEMPRIKGRTHDRSRSVRQIKKTLASQGPSTHASSRRAMGHQKLFDPPSHVARRKFSHQFHHQAFDTRWVGSPFPLA